MSGYIGSKAAVVSNGAERKKTYSITGTTTSLTGLSYTVNQVHVFHNGVRLVDGTDFTATNGNSITLTNAAQSGDEVVVISYAGYQVSDTVSASQGGTFSGDVEINGDLTVDTNTLYVDSTNDRVGVGTSSPSGAKLDIFTGSSTADGLKINRYASGVYYSTLRQDSHGLAIHVGDGSSIVERVAITPNGITFNGDTAAANALDDYEEGTFLPTFLGDTTNPSVTYHSGRNGLYTKVGNIVHVSLFIEISALASAGSGGLAVGNLPFTSSSAIYFAGTVGYVSGWDANKAPTRCLAVPNGTKIALYHQTTSDPRSATARLQCGDLDTQSQVYLQVSYRTS